MHDDHANNQNRDRAEFSRRLRDNRAAPGGTYGQHRGDKPVYRHQQSDLVRLKVRCAANGVMAMKRPPTTAAIRSSTPIALGTATLICPGVLLNMYRP